MGWYPAESSKPQHPSSREPPRFKFENGNAGEITNSDKSRAGAHKWAQNWRLEAADNSLIFIFMSKVYATPYSIRRYMGKNSLRNILDAMSWAAITYEVGSLGSRFSEGSRTANWGQICANGSEDSDQKSEARDQREPRREGKEAGKLGAGREWQNHGCDPRRARERCASVARRR